MATLGWFVFAIQTVLLAGFVFLVLSFDGMPVPGPNPPQSVAPDITFDVQFALGTVIVWLAPLFVGAVLTRAATRRREGWSAHFLFCALFVGLACGASWFVLVRLHLFNSTVRFWSDSFDWAQSGTTLFLLWQALSVLLAWSFPLSVPLAEITLRYFKRPHKTNKTGSFV